jgi:hypothetical protein
MRSNSVRIAGCLGALVLPAMLAACVGPPVQVVPNEHSQGRSEAEITADLAHCEEIAGEVLDEYGPHPPYSDNPFDDAATLRGYRTRYEAACMRAKGYEVEGSLGQEISQADLPASAVEKARGSREGRGPAE